MNANSVLRAVSFLAVLPIMATAQVRPNSDPVVLKHWAAPLYWLPRAAGAAGPQTQPADPNPLVFVAMTPCRVVDTRTSQGFPAAFGPPSLVAGASRTFPLQSSASCSIPAAAQAYSFNVTVAPAGPSGFITAYPTGQTLPLAATLVWSGGALTSNAAIVPGGTNGSIDVYANIATDIVIDINGYYAPGGFGASNTALGSGALSSNTTGSNNAAVGGGALGSNTTGSFNSALGDGALSSNTVGQDNTAVGRLALTTNATGSYNTALGSGALYFNSAAFNTAVGMHALYANTTATNGTAVGAFALSSNTTGPSNTAGGAGALQLNTTGGANAAYGAGALQNNTTGSNNAGYGSDALIKNTTGADNTAYGAGALENNTGGSNNIAIGVLAASNIAASSSNNIHIGSAGAAADADTIRIGSPGTHTSFFTAGVFSATTGNNNAVPVLVDSNGQLGTVSSSRRFKEEIQDMGDASRGILQLRPVTFRYRKPFDDGSKPLQYGLIAEEVADVFPDLVARSANGQIETVKYQVLDSLLLNEVQRQDAEIRALKERLARLVQIVSDPLGSQEPDR